MFPGSGVAKDCGSIGLVSDFWQSPFGVTAPIVLRGFVLCHSYPFGHPILISKPFLVASSSVLQAFCLPFVPSLSFHFFGSLAISFNTCPVQSPSIQFDLLLSSYPSWDNNHIHCRLHCGAASTSNTLALLRPRTAI